MRQSALYSWTKCVSLFLAYGVALGVIFALIHHTRSVPEIGHSEANCEICLASATVSSLVITLAAAVPFAGLIFAARIFRHVVSKTPSLSFRSLFCSALDPPYLGR